MRPWVIFAAITHDPAPARHTPKPRFSWYHIARDIWNQNQDVNEARLKHREREGERYLERETEWMRRSSDSCLCVDARARQNAHHVRHFHDVASERSHAV
jgi:hypothetical protein